MPVVDRVIVDARPRRVDDPVDIADLYDEMVADRRDDVVRAVELIADHTADGPVLVHCMAGKDRTGIVVALVQAAIGVPLASIVEEYARSDGPTRLRRVAMIADPHPGDPDVASAAELIWTAPAETMELFAPRAVARHGSLEDVAAGDRRLRPLDQRPPPEPPRSSDDRLTSCRPGRSTMRLASATVSTTNRRRPRPRNTESCVSHEVAAFSIRDTRPMAATSGTTFGATPDPGPHGPGQDDDLFDARLPSQRLDGDVDTRRVGEVDGGRRPGLVQPLEQLRDQPLGPVVRPRCGATGRGPRRGTGR